MSRQPAATYGNRFVTQVIFSRLSHRDAQIWPDLQERRGRARRRYWWRARSESWKVANSRMEPGASQSSSEPSAVSSASGSHRRGRARRWSVRVTVGMLALALIAELVGRFAFGLGHPALFSADPAIEYLYQPNQDIRRFGSHLHFNAYSMRSDDFPEHKSDPRELRVMVIGDSVVNGGAKTDQSELATTLLQRELAVRLKRTVIVGNISAPSWGPPNMLAYARRFGFFDADVVVIVLNSNDSFDVPTFEPIVGMREDYPDRRPWFALQEVVSRYVLPRLR